MTSGRTLLLYGVLSLSVLGVLYGKHKNAALKDHLFLGLRWLFLLCVCTSVASAVYHRLHVSAAPPPPPATLSEDDVRRKQEQARIQQQEKLNEKAFRYQESVLTPRQELKLRRREERLYCMSGERWKLMRGQPLGEGQSPEEHPEEEGSHDTPNIKASRRRKLPECATRVQATAKPPPKKVVLPDEPQENTEGVVRLALRCPGGRIVHRRFLKSQNSQVLLDWMVKCGFHPVIYMLCTSYPRRPVHVSEEMSLQVAGFGNDTVLNVEEREEPAVSDGSCTATTGRV